MSKFKLIQSAGMVGGLTLLSRVLGMGRDIVSAGLFGTTRIWDAFVFAFTIPNLLRRLVFEGAVSSAFIPIFVEISKTHGREEARKFAGQVMTSLLLLLFILAFLFYGLLGISNSFGFFSEKWKMAFNFLAILFPYVFLLLAVAVSMGVLNSEKHFFTPAMSQIILNLAWIIGVLFVAPIISRDPLVQIRILCFIIVLSGFVQLAIQWFPLHRRRFAFKLVWNFASPWFSRFLSVLLPAAIGFSVFNLNILMDYIFGYFLPEGASSSLWYASRLMQFPMGLFAVSLGTVLLPEYSHHATADEKSKINETISFSLRSVGLIIIPATVGLIVLAHPIVRVLFERGEFTELSTLRTRNVLIAYTLGLPFYSALPSLAAAFYGIQDMKTPLKAGITALISHLLLNFILWPLAGESGFALSTAIAGIINFCMLAFLFRREIGSFEGRRFVFFIIKIFGVSLFMGWITGIIFGYFSFLNEYLQLSAAIAGGIGIYIFICLLFRIHEMRRAFEWILLKK